MNELGARVAALSTTKLALLSLRLRERRAELVNRPVRAHEAPVPAPIPRLAREADATASALERLDGLSDAEVDELLRREFVRDSARTASRAGGAPGGIPRVVRDREAELLAGLENLSDDEVDSLLDELMCDLHGKGCDLHGKGKV